jgi:hypothetical protein
VLFDLEVPLHKNSEFIITSALLSGRANSLFLCSAYTPLWPVDISICAVKTCEFQITVQNQCPPEVAYWGDFSHYRNPVSTKLMQNIQKY